MSTYSPRSQSSGFTLVEVAVALAIFVFGALAIVQIFPPALGVIRNNESRVTATQLGESTLANMQTKTSGAPEAVFSVDAASTNPRQWTDYPGAIVGSADRNNSLPKAPTETAFAASSLSRFRYIYGEPHYIAPNQTVLLNYPYDDTLSNLTFFVDEIVEGVQLSADGYLDFTNATYESSGAAFNDSSNGFASRAPDAYRGPNTTYYVSYRWREYVAAGSPPTYTSVKGVIEEPLVIRTNSDSYSPSTSSRVLTTSVNSLNRVIPGGTKVRVRRTITLTTSGAIDLGSQRKIISITNAGSSPATLYCNYLASDWRNLSEDSAPRNDTVNLPLEGIETSTLLGILTSSNKSSTPTLKAPDLSTPTKIKQAQKGLVAFPGTSGTGARLRTVYQSAEGWAHQPSVAPRSYLPYDTARSSFEYPSEPWREYFWSGASATAGQLYFHAGDAGKTVAVTYVDGSGNTISNAVINIKDDLVAPPTAVPAAFAPSGRVAVADITNLSGNPVNASSILAVQGLSLHARTAWINGDRYNQVIVPAYRKLVQ